MISVEIRNRSGYYKHLNGNAIKGHSNAKTPNKLLYVNVKQVPTQQTKKKINH